MKEQGSVVNVIAGFGVAIAVSVLLSVLALTSVNSHTLGNLVEIGNNKDSLINLLEWGVESNEVHHSINARLQATLHRLSRAEAEVYRLGGEAYRSGKIDKVLLERDVMLLENDRKIDGILHVLWAAHMKQALAEAKP